MIQKLSEELCSYFLLAGLLWSAQPLIRADAAELPLVRIAHAAFEIKLTAPGIQNMQRLVTITNPKVKTVKIEDVVDEEPFQRLEKSAFYRELVAQTKK